MTGTLINVAAVLVGTTVGLALGERLSHQVRSAAMAGLGLVVLLIGAQMALKSQNVLVLLASMVLGGTLGAVLQIEKGLDGLGNRLEAWVERRRVGTHGRQSAATRDGEYPGTSSLPGPSDFTRAFVTASLVFCVGPMTVVGSIQDGLTGDYSILAVKSMLDMFASIAFASTLGIGVYFSAITILVYQGSLSLAAALAGAFIPEPATNPAIAEMTAAGGLLILGIGLRLLEVKRLPVADLLPAILLAPAITALMDKL